MNILRVIAIQKNSLLSDGLSSLLNSVSTHKLVHTSAQNAEDLSNEIFRLKPDVILLAENSQLVNSESLSGILFAHPKLRIVVVSENSNWLQIFYKKEVLLTQFSDLLAVINAD